MDTADFREQGIGMDLLNIILQAISRHLPDESQIYFISK
jgi:hypothetical protein